MPRVAAWVLHAFVVVVLLRGVGAFARSVGATAYVGLAAVTALGVAAATLVTVLLLSRRGDRTWVTSPAGLATRLGPVPAVLALLSGWQVAQAGGGAPLVLLALASWLVGAGPAW